MFQRVLSVSWILRYKIDYPVDSPRIAYNLLTEPKHAVFAKVDVHFPILIAILSYPMSVRSVHLMSRKGPNVEEAGMF